MSTTVAPTTNYTGWIHGYYSYYSYYSTTPTEEVRQYGMDRTFDQVLVNLNHAPLVIN